MNTILKAFILGLVVFLLAGLSIFLSFVVFFTSIVLDIYFYRKFNSGDLNK